MNSTIGNVIYRVRECLTWPGEIPGAPISTETRELLFWPQRDTLCKGLAVATRVVMARTTIESGRLASRYIEEDVTEHVTVTSSNPSVLQWGSYGLLIGVKPGLAQVRASMRYRNTEYAAVMTVRVLDSDDPYSCCAALSAHILFAVDLTESMTMSIGRIGRRLDATKYWLNDLLQKLNLRKNKAAIIGFTHEQVIPISTPASAERAILRQRAASMSATQHKTSFTMLLDYAYSYFDALLNEPAHPEAREQTIPILCILSDFQITANQNSDAIRHKLQLIQSLGVTIVSYAVAPSVDGALTSAIFARPGYNIRAVHNVSFRSLDEHPAYLQLVGELAGLCGMNCYHGGHSILRPDLSYASWQYWWVDRGTSRLLGNGLWDVMPGSGQYMDLLSVDGQQPVLWSINRYPLTANKKYRLSVVCAPNNRVALPLGRTDKVKISLIRLDDVPSVGAAPDPAAPLVEDGDPNDPENVTIPEETYQYAFTWQDDNGGQSMPSANPTSASVTRRKAVVRIALPNTTSFPTGFDRVIVWKHSATTGQWYKLAAYNKNDSNYPTEHHDRTRDADMLAGAHPAMRPPYYVTAGTRVELASRVLDFNTHQAAWTELRLEYTPTQNQTDVIIEIAQLAVDVTGTAGLLIDSVRFHNDTDRVPVLEDDFSQENFIELPNPCAQNPNHVLCDGEGCPPYARGLVPTPMPMPTNVPQDIELGAVPTGNYRASAYECVTSDEAAAGLDVPPWQMPPGPNDTPILSVPIALQRQKITPQTVQRLDCPSGAPEPPPEPPEGSERSMAGVAVGSRKARWYSGVGINPSGDPNEYTGQPYCEKYHCSHMPNVVFGENNLHPTELRTISWVPLSEHGVDRAGTFRVRVRLWGCVELRQLTRRNTGEGILDFKPCYVSPLLYDPYRPAGWDVVTENRMTPLGLEWSAGWQRYWGLTAQERIWQWQWVTWTGPSGAWEMWDWSPDFIFHHTSLHHGHPNFHAGLLNKLETQYLSGSGSYANLGGCAAVRSWAPIVHAKLDPSLWARPGAHPDILRFAGAAVGFNLYMLSLYNRSTDQPLEVWTLNTTAMPVATASEDPGGHPALVLPQWPSLRNASLWRDNLVITDYGLPQNSTVMSLLLSPFPIALLDSTFEFQVTAGNNPDLALGLYLSTSDNSTAIVWPYARSQMLPHMIRWHTLKNQPNWQTQPFIQYLKAPGRPSDWFWPHCTTNAGWFETFIWPQLQSVAIEQQTAAGHYPEEEKYFRCVDCATWRGPGGGAQYCYEGHGYFPGEGADVWAYYMQGVHVVSIDVEEL